MLHNLIRRLKDFVKGVITEFDSLNMFKCDLHYSWLWYQNIFLSYRQILSPLGSMNYKKFELNEMKVDKYKA